MSSASTGKTKDGGIKVILLRPYVPVGQLSVTGGPEKPEEALGDTEVGPTLYHHQEVPSGQVTCLSMCESTMVPAKSQGGLF